MVYRTKFGDDLDFSELRAVLFSECLRITSGACRSPVLRAVLLVSSKLRAGVSGMGGVGAQVCSDLRAARPERFEKYVR